MSCDMCETYVLLGPSILDLVEENTMSDIYNKVKTSKIFVALYNADSDNLEEQRVELISSCAKNRQKHRFSTIMEKLEKKLNIKNLNEFRNYIKLCSVELSEASRIHIAQCIASTSSKNNAHSLVLDLLLAKLIRNTEKIEVDKNVTLTFFNKECLVIAGVKSDLFPQEEDLCTENTDAQLHQKRQNCSESLDYGSKLTQSQKWGIVDAILTNTQCLSMKRYVCSWLVGWLVA